MMARMQTPLSGSQELPMSAHLGLALFLLLPLALPAQSPAWADSKLTVHDGLELWLDASRQPAAWQAHGKPALLADSPVDVCYDASGHDRHFVQRMAPSQPAFLQAGQAGLLRFDGKDDHLSLGGQDLALNRMTLFIVAAPDENPGFFRGFLSFNETGKNDYITGFNLDQGPEASATFEVLNPEGAGFGGARDLLDQSFPFRETRILETHAHPQTRTVTIWVDGQQTGQRPWDPKSLRFQDAALAARFYSNNAQPPAVGSFLKGHVAEVLLYSRNLNDAEAADVRDYLRAKYRGLDATLARAQVGHRLQIVEDPPPVQVLRPGFIVRELPASLSNINAVQYQPDGRLFALAYRGPIFVLTDKDGDGLEESAEVFWESASMPTPISMTLTPPGYPRGEGVFVTTRGKVLLILDTDGDGRGDREEEVATGWRMPDVIGGGGIVEVLGLAVAPDGSVYFGLGTDNYANAYRLDKDTGKAAYDVTDVRGTIQRVSPDFRARETVCTGIRYPVGLAFNERGDLFCADQEGATWLPNGNPFDELLHIMPGRHYGFPPRHPRHLPDVIDEPSVFDYGPQHQSTCGLKFNLPVGEGPVFGPPSWEGHALVAGESRGKIYLTQLVPTPSGYVARNEILACLNHLTIDTAVSPRGELVIATHGGQPDWGTGPNGAGSLFKIQYSDPTVPQPVLAWAQAENEVRVTFDRPLPPEWLHDLQPRTRIEFGRNVRAGDAFETMRPGYEVVGRQMLEPRFDLDVLDVKVTPDRQTLVLATRPQHAALPHAVTLPDPSRTASPAPGTIPQHARIDLGYDLSGLSAVWRGRDGAIGWTGWLPHPDSAVSRVLTASSEPHAALWNQFLSPGQLTLTGQLNIQDMLRPAVQAGAALDYQWPDETVFVTFEANTELTALRSTAPRVAIEKVSPRKSVLRLNPGSSGFVPFQLEWASGPRAALSASWHTAEDARPRALPLHRILVPWASPDTDTPPSTEVRDDVPELAGGNWGRGRQIFFSEEAMCSKCHAIHGQGTAVGPDLSNLIFRDYASVLRDIREPSVVLNPDHLSFEIALADGDSLTGTVSGADTAEYLITEGPGVQRRLARTQVASMRPLATSLMPSGFDQVLGQAKLRDLLTFLLIPPPRMPHYGPLDPPPARTRESFQELISGSAAPPATWRPRHVVLVDGPKDHGPGEHDYPAWSKTWSQLLSAAPNLSVTTASVWPSAEDLKKADALVFYQRGEWNEMRDADIKGFLARGGGVTYLHWALEAGGQAPQCAQVLGLSSNSAQTRYRHGELDLDFNREGFGSHPILRNLTRLHLHDETYWNLRQDAGPLSVLATAVEEGAPHPQIWIREQGQGRIFGNIMGHYAWTFDDPLFRVLLLRGIAWSMHEPVDRFNELATLGVTWK